MKMLRYVGDHVHVFHDFDHNDHVDNWKEQIDLDRELIKGLVGSDPGLEDLVSKLESIVSQMRYVKAGDFYFARDHNLFVDAWKIQLEFNKRLLSRLYPVVVLWQPERGDDRPTFSYTLHPIYTFRKELVAELPGAYGGIGIAYITTRDRPSLVCWNSETDTIRIYALPSLDLELELTTDYRWLGHLLIDADADGLAEIIAFTYPYETAPTQFYVEAFDNDGSKLYTKLVEDLVDVPVGGWEGVGYGDHVLVAPYPAPVWWSLHKIRGSDGYIVWSVPTLGPLMVGRHENLVFLADYDGENYIQYLRRIDGETGHVRWEDQWSQFEGYGMAIGLATDPYAILWGCDLVNYVGKAFCVNKNGTVVATATGDAFLNVGYNLADFDGDGNEELALWSSSDYYIYIYKIPDLALLNAISLGSPPDGEAIAVDFGGDGKFDIVAAFESENAIICYDLNGNALFAIDTISDFYRFRPWIFAIADVDEDGEAELIVRWEDRDANPYLAILE